MDYTVSDTKLQDLNVIVGEKGGVIPSEVSEALRKAQISAASGAQVTLQANLNEAIEANKKNGAAWSDVQSWHDSVKTSAPPVEPPVEPPPVTTLPPPPVAPAAGAVGGRWAVTATEAPQHFLFDGPASRVSIAVADGKQVWIGYHAQPDQFVEGQASASSGTAVVFSVPAGRWHVNYKLSPGMGGSAHGDISAY